MLNCTKCYSAKELSIKSRYRDGRVRQMICKSCRRAEYRLRKQQNPYVAQYLREEKKRIEKAVWWDMLATEINGRIIKTRSYYYAQNI